MINLLRVDTGSLDDSDIRLASALADIATIGVLNERTIRRAASTASALQHALTSRITIEQAKGVIAERSDVSVDEAFDQLRGYARRHRLGLTEVADRVVRHRLQIT